MSVLISLDEADINDSVTVKPSTTKKASTTTAPKNTTTTKTRTTKKTSTTTATKKTTTTKTSTTKKTSTTTQSTTTETTTTKTEVQPPAEHNLIDNFYLGMSVEDLASVMDDSLIYDSPTYTSTDDDGNNWFIIDLAGDAPLGTYMSSSMLIKTDSNFSVIQYGYLIGCSVDNSATSLSFPYTIEELTAEYDNIDDELCSWYGEGTEADITDLDTLGVVKRKKWKTGQYGDVDLFVGEDLFGDAGMNCIYAVITE